MPSYASPPADRAGDVVGTLRLLAYLALSITLIILDHRGGWLSRIREKSELLVQPVWWVAGLPARLGDGVRDNAATRSQLSEDNRALRNALLINGARQARLQAAAAENERLRGLLGVVERSRLDVQLAPILDIDLDPTRQRLVLNLGSADGVSVGQTVIDAGGVLGQIIDVRPSTATVLLLTDPDHAIPVAVARSGVRLVVYGRGDRLELANVPLSSDVKIGDVVVTSGLGGRFPAGFPVGTISALRPDDSRAFLAGDLKPAAQLDRGRDVLLLKRVLLAPDPLAASAAKTQTAVGAAAVSPTQAQVRPPGAAPSAPAQQQTPSSENQSEAPPSAEPQP